jgi:hypothetical protein
MLPRFSCLLNSPSRQDSITTVKDKVGLGLDSRGTGGKPTRAPESRATVLQNAQNPRDSGIWFQEQNPSWARVVVAFDRVG